jgi:hypothetical protein
MIEYKIDVNDTRLQVALGELPKQLRRRLKGKIGELTNQLLRMVKAREPVRTGRMRSRTHAYVDENVAKNFVRGRVRIIATGQAQPLAAAFGALEYGSTGRRFPVKSYRRGSGQVRAYERRGGIREMRFLRGAAAVMLPRARAEIEEVLNGTVRDALK